MDPRAIQINTLTSAWRTGGRTQDHVLQVLRDVPQGELEHVVDDLDLDQVLDSVDDRWRGPDRRTQLLQLLLQERAGELSTQSLAEVIGVLHRGRTPRASQEKIVELLVSREGTAFHDLKYRLNATGDHHDLEHLVFDHLDEDLRTRLLGHIAAQAQVDPTSDLRVLCDIDDTVTCAIHDDRYPRGTIYPGVVALLHALDEGAAEKTNRAGDLTFVTARPGGPRGLVEQYTLDHLSHLGLPPHAVLGGSFLNLHTKSAIAERKVQNMERDRLLFPECRMVFIGDSGQADANVGAQMHERDPGHIVGTLLHNVTDLDDPARQEWAAKGVHVFDTYAGAAVHAARLGLIRVDQARAVASAVRTGLAATQLGGGQRERLERDLAADVAALAALDQPGWRPGRDPGTVREADPDRPGAEEVHTMTLTSKASTTWTGTLAEGSGRTSLESSGQGTFDVSWRARAEEHGGTTNPEELIAAAHASCYSMAFSGALGKNGTPPTQLDTTAEVTFDPTGPAITGIHLSVRASVEGLDESDFQRMAQEAKEGCPVSKALSGTQITLTASLVTSD